MTIVLGSNSIFYREWNDDIDDYELTEFAEKDSLLYYYGNVVDVLDGVTFGEVLWHFIDDINSEIISSTLISEAASIPNILEQFAEVLRMEGDLNYDLDYVEISYPNIVLDEFEESHFPRWDFHGWGNWTEPYEGAWDDDMPRTGPIAIEYTPICNLKHVPFKIREFMEVHHSPIEGNARLDFTTERLEVYSTVFDLIRSIVWEMTWEGVVRPGDRTRLDDIKEMVDQLDRDRNENDSLEDLM